MRSSRNQKCRSTNSSRTATCYNPISFHPSHQSQSRQCHSIGLVIKIQVRRKSINIKSRIQNFQLETQESSKFQKASPQSVDIDLEGIRKVNQHVLRFFLPTGNV
mmetsp:Transcript_2342/g.6744  ORF Transcript_2342/g.6744 Transcript_2342/m.6744 type:complete len:105 (-) Transcript_2342:47-361(-)